MRFYRLTVLEEHVASLEQALSFALSCWTARLQESDSIEWRTYAVEVHTIRNRMATARPLGGGRSVLLLGNITGALRAVADCCEESDDPDIRELAALARHYADVSFPTRGDGPVS